MGQSENLTTVKEIYEAFGRGDVDAILEHVVDDPDVRGSEDTAPVADVLGL